jgi:hypothetical protein
MLSFGWIGDQDFWRRRVGLLIHFLRYSLRFADGRAIEAMPSSAWQVQSRLGPEPNRAADSSYGDVA